MPQPLTLRTKRMVVRPWWLTATLSLLLVSSATADEVRERQLELDVAQLRRELLEQTRRIDGLERLLRVDQSQRASSRGTKAAEAEPGWLVAANWNRVRPSMTELEVIAILGTPSSVRAGSEASTRTLLYALEIGTGSFLAGSVELGPNGVTVVSRPALR